MHNICQQNVNNFVKFPNCNYHENSLNKSYISSLYQEPIPKIELKNSWSKREIIDDDLKIY